MHWALGPLRLSSVLGSRAFSSSSSALMVTHLNHAGASPSPPAVLDRLIHHLHDEVELGGYAAQDAVLQELEQVYASLGQLLGCAADSLAIVPSATAAWTRFFYAAAEHQERHSQRRTILVSQIEYAASLVAVSRWASTRNGWTSLMLKSSQNGQGQTTGKVSVEALRKILAGNDASLDPASIAMVLVTHVPTNSGVVNPVNEIGALLHEYNGHYPVDPIYYLVDTCQSLGQLPVNVTAMRCHACAGTGRKYLRAPRGTGCLYVHPDVNLWPSQVDHFGVPMLCVPESTDGPVETILEYAPLSSARRFEFWESNIAGKLGLGKAVDHVLMVGIDKIASDIQSLAVMLYERLQQLDDRIRLSYPPECGIVTFWVEGMDSALIQKELWEGDERFEVSVVPATSTPLDSALTKVPNLVRASVSYTNTPADMERFCQRLAVIIAHPAQGDSSHEPDT